MTVIDPLLGMRFPILKQVSASAPAVSPTRSSPRKIPSRQAWLVRPAQPLQASPRQANSPGDEGSTEHQRAVVTSERHRRAQDPTTAGVQTVPSLPEDVHALLH